MNNRQDTSWEASSDWYAQSVGALGHEYHQKIILPGVLRLACFDPGEEHSLLDLCCGEGVLARALPKGIAYLGVDASPSLIAHARTKTTAKNHTFLVHDLTRPLDLQGRPFSHAACILALQNLEDPLALMRTACQHLKPGGVFLLVLNHPCFRIPRQSHWGFDEQKKLQFRRLDLYMSPLKIPIQTRPSAQEKSPQTWSFHRPLSAYSAILSQAGFLIQTIEEWCSHKISTGKMAAAENRSRKEFPLFLALVARKI